MEGNWMILTGSMWRPLVLRYVLGIRWFTSVWQFVVPSKLWWGVTGWFWLAVCGMVPSCLCRWGTLKVSLPDWQYVVPSSLWLGCNWMSHFPTPLFCDGEELGDSPPDWLLTKPQYRRTGQLTVRRLKDCHVLSFCRKFALPYRAFRISPSYFFFFFFSRISIKNDPVGCYINIYWSQFIFLWGTCWFVF